jgi:hypothetical protein
MKVSFVLLVYWFCVFIGAVGGAVVSVVNQIQFVAALNNDTVIELTADIYITSTITISNLHSLSILGNGFKIDGQSSYQCLYIVFSDVNMTNIQVTNGYAVRLLSPLAPLYIQIVGIPSLGIPKDPTSFH